ncbi:MAG: polysaccharide deacetylase family protein [Alphaproteobacteria bacterium]|nr:polysaccharide deacetylase family protein [Alphaproteobacteria bacterium]
MVKVFALVLSLFISANATAAEHIFAHGPGITDNVRSIGAVVYLTLDAADSRPNGYDATLIEYLRKERIPATLFLNHNWIEANQRLARELAADPLFKVENHGVRNRPATVAGMLALNMPGALDPKRELLYDIRMGSEQILRLSGRAPTWFRSAIPQYDSEAVEIILGLNLRIAGFAIDLASTATPEEVERKILAVRPGDIIRARLDRPESETAEGIRRAAISLHLLGYRFEKLPD